MALVTVLAPQGSPVAPAAAVRMRSERMLGQGNPHGADEPVMTSTRRYQPGDRTAYEF